MVVGPYWRRVDEMAGRWELTAAGGVIFLASIIVRRESPSSSVGTKQREADMVERI